MVKIFKRSSSEQTNFKVWRANNVPSFVYYLHTAFSRSNEMENTLQYDRLKQISLNMSTRSGLLSFSWSESTTKSKLLTCYDMI